MVSMTERARPDADPLLPLWRSAQVFRLASLAYAVAILAGSMDRIVNLPIAWALMAVQVAWSGFAVAALSAPRRAPLPWLPRLPLHVLVVVDVLLTIALVFGSWLGSPPHSWLNHDVLPTMLWTCNAIISAAILWGRRIGMLTAFVVAMACNVVTGDVRTSLAVNATLPVLVCVGLAVGALARTATHANDQLRAAVELRAATEERERLARQVHDGALQVLSLVSRREGAVDRELAAMARTQEQSLRHLLTQLSPSRATASRMPGGSGSVDLASALAGFAGERVSVSAPQDPVVLPAAYGEELVAAAREALQNVTAHAGPDARAYVLLEDLGDEVVLTVRDDGPGIPAGRLAQATAQGRLGASQSIRGRIESLGGTAVLETAPGEGTEWELRVPRAPEGTGP
jgi:signal transduction histidine kinase